MFNSFLGKAISAELTCSKVVETEKVLTRTIFSEKSFKTTFLEAKCILNVNYIYKYKDYTNKKHEIPPYCQSYCLAIAFALVFLKNLVFRASSFPNF